MMPSLMWQLYLTLDEITALASLVEDRGVQDDSLHSAYERLSEAREHAVESEVAWMRTSWE